MAKSKTPKKSNAVNTPAKAEVKTPKQAKNTPAKEVKSTPKAVQTPKMKKEVLKEVNGTPKAAPQTPKMKKAVLKEANGTPKAAPQTPKMKKAVLKEAKSTPKVDLRALKSGTVSAKKAKKAKTLKRKPVEDIEMATEEQEEVAPAMKEDEIQVEPETSGDRTWRKRKAHRKDVKFGLFVHGLNCTTDEASLIAHFSQFGALNKVVLPLHCVLKNLNKGYCFVYFHHKDHMNKVLKSAHTLDGVVLQVTEKIRKKDMPNNKRKRDDSEEAVRVSKKPTYDNAVLVTRLKVSTNKNTIKKHFSQFGEVVSVKLPVYESVRRGFAVIEFKENSSMKKAVADSNSMIDGAKIVVQPRKGNGGNVFADWNPDAAEHGPALKKIRTKARTKKVKKAVSSEDEDSDMEEDDVETESEEDGNDE